MKKKQVAFVTGITGQDGVYLAELLVSKGYRVVGASRSGANGSVSLDLISRLGVEIFEWNPINLHQVMGVIEHVQPQEFYNLAALSSGQGMYDEPIEIGEVNGLAVARLLEGIRLASPATRFCQASSREVFGEAIQSPQDESTPTNPRSPYGAAKQYADSMIRIYRQRYGIFACSAFLFNHESPRRRLEFVTRKISYTAARIKLGLANKLSLGSLEAQRDWGFAGDYVQAMWLMLQHPVADDYVVATGESHSVREFCECAFEYLDLDFRDYFLENISASRPLEAFPLVGSAEKAKRELGWRPTVGFQQLVWMMVDADLQRLSAESRNSVRMT